MSNSNEIFNINNNIYIQINDNGWEHLKKTVEPDYIKHCVENHKVEINGEIWYKLQCHQVFDLFPINHIGNPFFNTNILIDDKDLE